MLGPATEAPADIIPAGDRSAPLPLRLWHYYRAACKAGTDASVVDAHFALYALAPVLIGRLRRLPLVVHFQGPWAAESAVQGHSGLNIAGKRLVERAVYRRADTVIVLSYAFKRLLVDEYRVPPWRIQVIPPGVDLAAFHPGDRRAARTALCLPAEGPMVLAVRRLVPRMGLDVLLEAWALIRSRFPEALLVICGEGPQLGSLTTQAARLGISPTVRFLGRVDEVTLALTYQAADLAVVPSSALEGFGLIVLEALASGTPVLGTDVGGLPEVLSGLDPQLICAAGNAPAMADRLCTMLESSSNRPSARQCRDYAQHFNWEATAKQHRGIYADVQSPPRPKLRIVYIDHCARLSGGELALLRLLPSMHSVDAHVILAENGPLVAKFLQAGISVEVIGMPDSTRDVPRGSVRAGALGHLHVPSVARYILRLAIRLRHLNPDLVHTNSLKAALYGGMAGRLAGVPVVWHIRDRISSDYLPNTAVRLVKAASRRLPNAVISNSQSTCDALGDTGMIQAVIPSPIATTFHARGLAGRPGRLPGALRVGIVGRLAPWKGQDLFLRAFARSFPTEPVTAVIIGSALFGETAYEETLHRTVEDLGLTGRVEFRGFRDDICSELALLDIVVHASITPEPFGLVVAEAMACGLPVIAAGSGGPAEMIEDGVSGILYPMGDALGLSTALSRLAPDRALQDSMGAAAHIRTAQFLPEVIARQVMATYLRVLDLPDSELSLLQ